MPMTDAQGVAKALLKGLREFTCEDVPEQFSDDNEMYEEGDETAPFFTEACLYNLLGKSDARCLLGRWEQLESAIASALAQREREVWEKAATEVMRYHNAFLHDGFRGELKRLAEWCRRQGGGG